MEECHVSLFTFRNGFELKKNRLVILPLERVGIELPCSKVIIVELAGILAKVTGKLIGNFYCCN